jgi:hypothetical protein
MEPEEVGMNVGFTTPELILILATRRWQAAGEPGEDSDGRPVIDPVGLAGREADAIEEQLPEGWDTVDEEGFVNNEVHYVFIPMAEGQPMTRWFRYLLTEVYDTDVEEEV